MSEFANIFSETVVRTNNVSFHMISLNINANFTSYQIIVIRESASFHTIYGRMIYKEHSGTLIMNNISGIFTVKN